MLRRLVGVGAAILLLAAGTAQAQDDGEPQYNRTAGYLGANGSYAINAGSSEIGERMKDSGGVSVWAGYRMARAASFEIQFEWQDGMSDINGWDLTFNVNWYFLELFWQNKRWQPFFVTGAGFVVAKPRPNDGTELNGAFRLGGGLDYWINDHWTVRAKGEWVTGVGRLSELRYAPLSLGFSYNW